MIGPVSHKDPCLKRVDNVIAKIIVPLPSGNSISIWTFFLFGEGVSAWGLRGNTFGCDLAG